MSNDKQLYNLQNQNSVCAFLPTKKKAQKPKLDGSEIPVVNQYKFIGVIFYKKLSFIPHIQYLKDKCNKILKILRIILFTNPSGRAGYDTRSIFFFV